LYFGESRTALLIDAVFQLHVGSGMTKLTFCKGERFM